MYSFYIEQNTLYINEIDRGCHRGFTIDLQKVNLKDLISLLKQKEKGNV